MYEQREEATETEDDEEEKLNHSLAPPGEARRTAMLGCLMWDLFLRGKLKREGEERRASERRVKRDKWLDVEAVNESILMRGAVCGCP